MKKLKRHLLITTSLALASAAAMLFSPSLFGKTPVDAAELLEKAPKITPDYTNTVIPPNIAPLNFRITEPGVEFRVKVYCPGTDGFVVASKYSNAWGNNLYMKKGL